MTVSHIPYRTCIATREKKPHTDLVRVVIDPLESARRSAATGHTVTVLVPDPGRRLPGRGAWITPEVTACHTAVARRAFERALKLQHRVDVTAVLAYVSTVHRD